MIHNLFLEMLGNFSAVHLYNLPTDNNTNHYGIRISFLLALLFTNFEIKREGGGVPATGHRGSTDSHSYDISGSIAPLFID